VYFHTNGFGDCVLFDRLGWPWQVHDCWLEHREQQQQRITEFERFLANNGYSGQFRLPGGSEIPRPEPKTARKLVKIQGYVADNHAQYENAKPIKFGSSGNWFRVQVEDNQGNLYPFLVPEKNAREIDDYLLVEARGYWVKIHGEWRLFATAFTSTDFRDHKQKRWRMASAVARHCCSFCHRPLGTVKWNFNEVLRPECVECQRLRGELSPKQFMKIAKWIGPGWITRFKN
jgi:hypothetical protein